MVMRVLDMKTGLKDKEVRRMACKGGKKGKGKKKGK